MQSVQYFSAKEGKLLEELNRLIKKYGFREVLSLLEYMASNQAEHSQTWEVIRKNLEDSIIEMEEWNISNDLN